MIACIKSIVLYRSELWWKKQKGREQELQKIHNNIGRCITGVWKTTQVEAIAKKANQMMAKEILRNKQRRVVQQTVVLSDTSK